MQYAEYENYTIPSDNRELQQVNKINRNWFYYTIPSDNRELQQMLLYASDDDNYTIPSDNRELQPATPDEQSASIIPYQVITGNYNDTA